MRNITLDVLPAGRGDCLWVECARTGLPPWRMLIDGGLPNCYPMLRQRLKTLAVAGPVFIDLVVVSHIDSDHIGGLLPLFAEDEIELKFGDIWFNGLPQLPEFETQSRSVKEGERLVDLLSGKAGNRVLPWNEAFDRAAAMTQGDGAFKTITFPNGPTLTLLSPTPRRLMALRKTWTNEVLKLQRGDPSDDEGAGVPLPLDDLRSLAGTDTPRDQSSANGSSIAFLLEYGGRRCLFGADAFSNVLGPSLTALANSRDGKPIELDVFKLPHHGSKKNVTVPLLAVAPAEHYVVSTNGERFSHPDDIALARIVSREGPTPTVWFNYRNDAIDRWNDPDLKKKNGFAAQVPASKESAGARILLLEKP
jgi:beta-lactamase superfamily II metal-dependent hydrolase